MKHFNWMVIDGITSRGIYFKATKTGKTYIFYWNPIKVLRVIFCTKDWSLGLPPILSKHINGIW